MQGRILDGSHGSVRVDGTSCVINDADVSGDIEITNADYVTVVKTRTGGNLKVDDSGVVALVGNAVKRNIRVRRNEFASIVANAATRTIGH